MKKLYFLFLLVAIVSCSEDFGSEVVGGDLTVFYTNAEDKPLASDLALFYKNNNLIYSEPQHIQITRIKKGYRINIIAKDFKEAQKMSFKNRKALLKLHGMLQDSVFINNKVDLIVCDDQFKPIIKINK
ncbi:MAG: hypothetical protein QNK78_09565 [Crocinitomicaceae bacterium]